MDQALEPSRTPTKAPKLTSFMTMPSMTSPTLKSATVDSHGSGSRRRIDKVIRPLVVDVDDLGLDLVADLVAASGC